MGNTKDFWEWQGTCYMSNMLWSWINFKWGCNKPSPSPAYYPLSYFKHHIIPIVLHNNTQTPMASYIIQNTIPNCHMPHTKCHIPNAIANCHFHNKKNLLCHCCSKKHHMICQRPLWLWFCKRADNQKWFAKCHCPAVFCQSLQSSSVGPGCTTTNLSQ